MNERIRIAQSSIADGSMSKSVSEVERNENRYTFLRSNDVDPARTVWSRLEYVGDDFCRYETIDDDSAGDGIVKASTITCDSMFTKTTDLAMLLPIADCIAAVLYDPFHQVLGLAHLGRHNLEQHGAKKSVEYMIEQFGTDPAELEVWLSPAAGSKNYPLHGFDNRSLHEVSTEQLVLAGVDNKKIEIDTRDTTADPSLFSHSEFLKGNRETDGRQAVVALMRS